MNRIKFKPMLLELLAVQDSITTCRMQGNIEQAKEQIKQRNDIANAILKHTNDLQDLLEATESIISDVY